jgi:hypothetical protein
MFSKTLRFLCSQITFPKKPKLLYTIAKGFSTLNFIPPIVDLSYNNKQHHKKNKFWLHASMGIFNNSMSIE